MMMSTTTGKFAKRTRRPGKTTPKWVPGQHKLTPEDKRRQLKFDFAGPKKQGGAI